jgi:hypothetical protein
MSTKEEVSLADFNWDNGDEFFEVKTAEPIIEEKSKVKEADENGPEKLDSAKDESNEEVDDFFDEEEIKAKELDSKWSDIYKELKTKGVLSIDVDDSEEIDYNKFVEIQEEEIETRLDEAIQDFMNELDDDAKAFLKFKREGGSTSEFFQMYQELSEVPEPITGDIKSQERFLEYYYKNYEDLDDDDIEDKIEWLKESGKLSKYAAKFHEQIKEGYEEQKEKLVEVQKQNALRQEEQKKVLIKDLKNLIDSNSSIKDWTLTQKDKKELHGYMTKPAIKLQNSQYLTQFQNDLQEVFKNKEKMILLAKLISSDFDITDVKEKAKTEVIKDARNKINNQKSNIINSTKGSRNKGLADYF